MIGRHFSVFVTGILSMYMSLTIAGCDQHGGSSGASSSTALDGTYQGPTGAPMTFDFKGDKVTVTIATERKVLSYKVEGDKITVLNPTDGDIVLMRNADGSLNSDVGVFSKKKP